MLDLDTLRLAVHTAFVDIVVASFVMAFEQTVVVVPVPVVVLLVQIVLASFVV